MRRTFFNARRALRQVAVGAAAITVQNIALAQQAPTNLVANEGIALQTITPLGEAKIEITPGTVLTNFEIQGERVRIWQGPFSATVDLAGLQTPAPAPQPTATATPSPASSTNPEQPAPSPEPTATPMPESSPAQALPPVPTSETESAPWPSWVPQAAVAALALYALFSTVALLRARRPAARATPAKPPVVILPKTSAAKPATVSDGGRAIACPLCGKDIPREKISHGRNDCPSCSGRFVCE